MRLLDNQRRRPAMRSLVGVLAGVLLLSACGGAESDPSAADEPDADDADDAEDDSAFSVGTGEVAAFYENNNLTIQVGGSATGSFGLYANLLADHWGRYIPGEPNIIVEESAGARGVTSMNYMANVAATDGSYINLPLGATALDQLLGMEGVDFDMNEFSPIGNLIEDVQTCVARADSGIETLQDVIDAPAQIGVQAPSETNFLNDVVGTQIDAVAGYAGGAEVLLAVEQGEVAGRCPWSMTAIMGHGDQELVSNLNIFTALTWDDHPLLPEGTPVLSDYLETEEERQLVETFFVAGRLGRTVMAPPGVPDDFVVVLRESFDQLMEDDDFLADAESRALDVEPVTGVEVEAFLEEFFETPQPVIERIQSIMSAD